MHPFMAYDIDECVEATHLKKKVTAVIPTSNSPIEFMLWSVFSLLFNSKPNGMLEHFCVCINGPDPRTGNVSLQDKKQAFLEELRDIPWYWAEDESNQRPMPLTVIRVWSRVGYGEAFEMALSWIHTDAYILMHDDVMLLNPAWDQVLTEKFYADDDVAIAYVAPLMGCPCDHAIHKGMYLLRLPQMQTTFLVCKKKWIMKAHAGGWSGYHIPSDDNMLQFDVEEIGDVAEFERFWTELGLYPKPILKSELYNFVRQEIGAWVHYKVRQLGKKFVELEPENILHFEGMSRNDKTADARNERVQECLPQIRQLEAKILAHPKYAELYKKYMPAEWSLKLLC